MEIVKYEREDVFPVVLTVLDYTAHFFCSIILKFILKDHYPDLRDKLDTNVIEESEQQLINELDDPQIALMRIMYGYIQLPIVRIMNLYALKFMEHEQFVKVDALALEIHWALTLDCFPAENEEDNYEDNVYESHLNVYIVGMIRIVCHLITLVDIEETDFNWLEIGEDIAYTHCREDYINKPHTQVFEYLFDLLDLLEEYKLRFLFHNYDLKTPIN